MTHGASAPMRHILAGVLGERAHTGLLIGSNRKSLTTQMTAQMTRTRKQNGLIPKGDYVYLMKIHFNGEIGNRSIGLPASDVAELMAILGKTSKICA